MPVLKPIRGIRLNKSHPFARGLIGYWLFNEGTGGKVFDLSGSGNNPILSGDTYFVPGKFGFALDFGGAAGDYAIGSYGGGVCGFVNAGTVITWVKLDTMANAEVVVGFLDSDGGSGGPSDINWMIYSNSASTMNFVVYDGSGSEGSGNVTVSLNVWHQIVGVWEIGKRISFYLDGVLASEDTTVSRTPVIVADMELAFGRLYAAESHHFDGKIDHVLIYNRALSAVDIARLYQKPFRMFADVPSPPAVVVVAPGIVEIAGDLAALSFLTDSADLRRARGIAGGVAAQSSLSGSIKVSKKISGAIAVTSSLVGALSLVGEVSRSRGSGFKPIEGAERLRGLRRSAFY